MRHDPLTDIEPRQVGPSTEAEARRVGFSATRIAQLRAVQKAAARGGSIAFQTDNGAQSLSLNEDEMVALTAFLMEREAIFLRGFGVTVEEDQRGKMLQG